MQVGGKVIKDNQTGKAIDKRTILNPEEIAGTHEMGEAWSKGGDVYQGTIYGSWTDLNENGLRHRHEFVEHKILDCLGDLMLAGHRIFGLVKTSQGGHQLTGNLLKNFFSEQSNWEFNNFEEKQKDPKDNTLQSPIAANA